MKRILIIDDEPHIIRVLKMALENAGYAVDEAYNGEQALAYLTDLDGVWSAYAGDILASWQQQQ